MKKAIPCTLKSIGQCKPKRDFATICISWEITNDSIPMYFDCNNCGFRIREGKEQEVDKKQGDRFLKQEKVLSDRAVWHK